MLGTGLLEPGSLEEAAAGELGRAQQVRWHSVPTGSLVLQAALCLGCHQTPACSRGLAFHRAVGRWCSLLPRTELGEQVSGLELLGCGNGYCPLILVMSLPSLLDFPSSARHCG